MKTHLLKYWERLRSSFWFIPSLMASAAVVLSFLTVALDENVTEHWLSVHSWAYAGGAEGASSVLSTVAASMIGIAGVVFSMTLVALSLASSQLGPRLLRNFMRDTANQVVLGTFISTFVYCLLVLRTIRRADEVAFVPHLSVTVGLLLAIFSLGVLIYFIHHVSVSIQADEVIARVAADLFDGIERIFPGDEAESAPHGHSRADAPTSPVALPANFDAESGSIRSVTDGYLQLVNLDVLTTLATESDLLMVLQRRPGGYVVRGQPLLRAWPADRITHDIRSRASAAFVMGNQRTPAQDVELGIHQLVEIAVRALSPGINDPFTANTCIDRLASAIARLAGRSIAQRTGVDSDGRVRVVTFGVTLDQLVDAAFDPIRQNARSSVIVTIRLLEAVSAIASATTLDPKANAALRRQADLIVGAARVALRADPDLATVEDGYRNACNALSGDPRPPAPA